MNKIKLRKSEGAVCPKCKSPDYSYKGRTEHIEDGKHNFSCNSCGKGWQYGKTDSVYTKLI